MEWGQNWLQPIQSRLAEKYPGLGRDELDEYNATCKKAMEFGHHLVYSMAEKGKDVNHTEWEVELLRSYPWVRSENRAHLFSQGMHCAWKDGLV